MDMNETVRLERQRKGKQLKTLEWEMRGKSWRKRKKERKRESES